MDEASAIRRDAMEPDELARCYRNRAVLSRFEDGLTGRALLAAMGRATATKMGICRVGLLPALVPGLVHGGRGRPALLYHQRVSASEELFLLARL